MKNLKVDINNLNAKDFQYSPNPGFGTAQIPITLSCDISRNNVVPDEVLIEAKTDITLSCFSAVLHYGQSIFEGLKAYRLENGEVGVFRLEDHAKRFRLSAEMMGMASFPEELFIDSVKAFLTTCKDYVPDLENHSFYIRPLLMANDPVIKVNSSSQYRFTIMGCIVGSYFKNESDGCRVLVNKDFVRAFPGGTGEAKTSANYAASLNALEFANNAGYQQVLYLDALTKTTFEELGGMNFFMIKNETLVTPKLNGQILQGITRLSILEIAESLNIPTEIRDIKLEEIFDKEQVSTVFASGTAATVAPIVSIGVQENSQAEIKELKFEQHSLVNKLRDHLKKTQRGQTSFSKKWLTII